ncbi:MAG: CpaF/VirB11 family protein [Eubacterium sp.]|nr:CpaF/VirB11 family protein [Eubacterium sp.]
MNEFQKKYLLKRQDYGVLFPYITSEEVTDINWNGKQLWIDDLQKGRFVAPEVLPEVFVERFVMLLANVTGMNFNRTNPVMEAETEELRISVVHESVARSGVTISIRKIPMVRRMTEESMLAQGYCSGEILDFMIRCIQSHCSLVIAGLPGVGKTELLKFLTQYIPSKERVITIEDVLEIHYPSLNPDKDCIEMKVAENFSYAQAIKASLRQFPKWIILSEARSREARQLLESLSTGACSITTLHAQGISDIPVRMKNMVGDLEGDKPVDEAIYRYIDVGILVSGKPDSQGRMVRKIEEIGVFEYLEGQEEATRLTMLAEGGRFFPERMPESMRLRLSQNVAG